MNVTKFRTSIWKNICELLLLSLEVFCEDFVDISYEIASYRILQDSIWLQVIYFLTTVAIWFVKYLFRIDGDNLRVLAKDFTLCSIYWSNQPLWKNRGIA